MDVDEVTHANSYLPHGTCISWDVPLLSLYVISDLFIALAYFSIPIAIVYFVHKRNEATFKPIYYLFALFIAACGITHVMNIVTLWFPLYYLAGFFKLVTAVVSIATAVYLVPKLSEYVQLPDLADIIDINKNLLKENKHRKQAELNLRTSQQKTDDLNQMLKTVLDAVPVRLFWKDLNLNYLGANFLFCRDAGMRTPEMLVGKSDFDMPWKDTYAKFYREDDQRVIDTGIGKLHFEEKLLDANGDEKWLATNKLPLINSQGDIFGVLGTYDEITQRKQMEAGLVVAKETAEEANKAKSQFLSRMSHELRTPLNGILGFSQLLQMDELTEKQKGYVTNITVSGTHLLDLINDILELSHIESGKMTVSIEAINVHELMQEIIPSIETQLETNHLTLAINIETEELWVKADSVKLKQLLFNLLSNAVKYNRANGTVTLSIQIKGEKLRFSIQDTGEGIPADMFEALFEPFNRLGKHKSSIEGTGIGLAISRQLARLMNTELMLDSVVGQGTTFWFDLPLTLSIQQYEDDASDKISIQLQNKNAGRFKVLYIEDNPANMMLMRQIMDGMDDVELFEAMTGEEGIEKALEIKPDIILLDIDLPGLNGFETLEVLNKKNLSSEMKVIAVTANAMLDEVARGHKAGFDDYITKPVDVLNIISVIENIRLKINKGQ
ncbi:MAG: ATP-binding protein [Gammaproteobacteria bacterium]|nr:ATP-binding protein [Gammaproteobacteria bacterium]